MKLTRFDQGEDSFSVRRLVSLLELELSNNPLHLLCREVDAAKALLLPVEVVNTRIRLNPIWGALEIEVWI